MSANVVVDLGVNTTATGTIDVFGQSLPTISNKVVASTGMNCVALYASASSGLIEFQGVDNNITARLAADFISGVGAATRKSTLANGIQIALTTGNLDASAADPFNVAPLGVAKYSDASYKNYSSFGELALGSYAHYLFGHVDATAAIDNDTTFVDKMNGRTIPPAANAGEADLANKLADAIFGMTSENATAIAKQVVGQDASRAFAVDNDSAGVDGWQKLLFKAGDKIYVTVILQRPTVTVKDNNLAQLSEPSNTLFPAGNVAYMIEITLTN